MPMDNVILIADSRKPGLKLEAGQASSNNPIGDCRMSVQPGKPEGPVRLWSDACPVTMSPTEKHARPLHGPLPHTSEDKTRQCGDEVTSQCCEMITNYSA